jgi:Carboxypeptidase regulatory-like domain/TonB-dependent Receptor Plug Domain
MPTSHKRSFISVLAVALLTAIAGAQSGGNSGSVNGTVVDATGAVIPKATVEIRNPVSGFDRTATTDGSGAFSFPNIPFNPYHLTVKADGFMSAVKDVEPRSAVPVNVAITLKVSTSSTQVTVQAEGGDLVENDSTFHTDVDKNLFDKFPLESRSSQVSALVTQTTPGIAADSNGLFHGLGDHAQNSFSVDGQPITDQQSKVFSNQIPLDAIQSMEVISGAPGAEYGDKTSVVINVTTQSGMGVTTPHGSVTTSYGSFGTADLGLNLAYGGKNWGNFISASGLNSGRFLDPPEFIVLHDKGNEENIFDRVDYQLSPADSIHLNLGYTRSWFQTPNSFDGQNATPWSGLDGVDAQDVNNYGGVAPNGEVVGTTDQRSQIGTFNIAPSWTRLISATAVFSLGAFIRRDDYHYYPSSDPFADLGPPGLQRQSVGQHRTLTNTGVRSDISYVKGINNIKAGVTYASTFLNENDALGIVDPTYNAPCLAFSNDQQQYVAAPAPGITDPAQCVGAYQPNTALNPNAPGSTLYPNFNPVLLPYDLTRGGSYYDFNGHTDVKELSLYVRDNVTKGNWSLNLGMRGDIYNGLTIARQAEPRLGVAYDIKKTSTVLRVSYARTLETPFNENLILSSTGCSNAVLAPLLLCTPGASGALNPGFRNEFHAGIEQAFGRYLVFSGEYITKYTHNGYDFSVLGNTPITFPIEWHNSKIPGYAGRVSVPSLHGFSAQMVFSSVAARFFQPQIGGAGATVATAAGLPFRIDHDERFNETTHFQYQPWKIGPWVGFNWRYDSGLVAGNAPCYGVGPSNDCPQSTTIGGQPAVFLQDVFGNPLSADQEFQAGFTCNGVRATPSAPLPSPCLASQFGTSLIKVPAIGTENDDHNPPRTASRSLFDVSVGHDNLLRGDKYRVSLQLTAINITNKYTLYNFLSTFSGTHYVTPRTLTAELAFHF